MENQSLENLLPKADYSIYKLVRMAATRALELSDGKKCLVDCPSSDKVTSMALEEIAQGKIVCKEVADQIPAEEVNADEDEKIKEAEEAEV